MSWPSHRGGQRAEPRRSFDRNLGQGAPRPAQQLANDDPGEAEHPGRSDHRLCDLDGRDMGSRFPEGCDRRTAPQRRRYARRQWPALPTDLGSIPTALFGLFDRAYPEPKPGARRPAPLLPYLFDAPSDLRCRSGSTAAARSPPASLSIDANGNVWSGVNWMPGSQSGVAANLGGGTAKYAPDGTALSPPITGFTGMGLDGVGWGTGGVEGQGLDRRPQRDDPGHGSEGKAHRYGKVTSRWQASSAV